MWRTNIKTIIIITLLVVFSLSATYAYINLTASNNNTAVGQGGCFNVNYSGQEISNASLVGTTTYTEGAVSQVTLSKNSDCAIYTEVDIKIHTNDTTTAPITGNYPALRYKIEKTSGDGEILSGGEGFVNQIGDMTLATVSLTETDTVYKVYIWLDISFSLGNYNNTIYSGYIYAESMQTSTIDVEPNAPNLDSGNLIPVYYDETEEVWKKADSNNTNNSWYDYDNKMWANAIMVSDSTKRATYQSADVGTTITEADISGFLVWIPRFKYRVWNITRQGGAESTYAYSAYTNGIEIEWERETTSTGNVKCTYNTANVTPDTTLSDTCVYNGTTTITPTSGNTNFTDAWYTHPAFTFNNEKTGFWIGKFETTGTAEAPTVLPDTIALVNQNVSTQFTTARVFQTYGLSTSVNAHMLTNLEWGAMAYLTHSIYGLCDGTSCRDAYINNSENGYTGRSAGVLAPSSTSDAYGTYNYKGYPIDSSTGSSTSTKDVSKVASTTGNITGVYDVVGGTEEFVMGNQVDSNNSFYPAYSGSNWNDSSILIPFYYNTYSYGETYEDQIAFNRARLGDATAEVTGASGNEIDAYAWLPGNGITGSDSCFAYSDAPWFIRSGYYGYPVAGSFIFYPNDGSENSGLSFRLSIS